MASSIISTNAGSGITPNRAPTDTPYSPSLPSLLSSPYSTLASAGKPFQFRIGEEYHTLPLKKHSINIPGAVATTTNGFCALGARKLGMSGNIFQLTVNITNAENDAPIAFKQDGQRFGTSTRTLKFHSDGTYKCRLSIKPPIEFQTLHLGGSDIQLMGRPGDYTAIWKTSGIEATRKGARHDILFVLSGLDGTLRQTFQTKFYAAGDSHADYGHKLDSLQWRCEIDQPSGTIEVRDETVL